MAKNLIEKNKLVVKLDRGRKQIDDAVSAWIMAEHPDTPKRQKIQDLYDMVMLDLKLQTAVRNRKSKVLGEIFEVYNAAGEIDEEKTKLLRGKTWFKNFVDHALDSVFYGPTVIELGALVEGEVSGVEILPRRNVEPVKGLLFMSSSDNKGTSYREPGLADYYIQAGHSKALGDLLAASFFVLYKRYGMGAWLEFTEKYADPIVHLATDSNDTGEMEADVQDMGKNRYIITKLEDKVAMLTVNGSSAEGFDKLREAVNEEITTYIQGQTMTSSNGSSRAQGEVHERTAEEIAEADKELIEALVNDALIPRLMRLGYGFAEGDTFRYNRAKSIPLADQIQLYTMLLDKYDIDPDHIEATFGVPVLPKLEGPLA